MQESANWPVLTKSASSSFIATEETNHNVDDQHDGGHGNQGLFHEADPVGEFDVLGGIFRIANELAEETGQSVGGDAEVAHGEGIAAGDLLHEGHRQSGHNGHHEAGEQGSDDDDHNIIASEDGHDREHTGGQGWR